MSKWVSQKAKKFEKLAGHLSGATGDKFCCTKLSLYSKSSVAVVCLQCFVFLSVAVQLGAANRAERTTANYKTLKEGAIGISSIRERERETVVLTGVCCQSFQKVAICTVTAFGNEKPVFFSSIGNEEEDTEATLTTLAPLQLNIRWWRLCGW